MPLVGGHDAQSVINTQLVDQADILFGVFYARLGMKTQRWISGTAEECRMPVSRFTCTLDVPDTSGCRR